MTKENKNKKPWYKTWWGIILIIFGVLIIIGIIVPDNSNKDNSTDTDTTLQTTTQNTPVVKELTEKEILDNSYNSAIKYNSSSYCINDKLTAKSIDFCKFLFATTKNTTDTCNELTVPLEEMRDVWPQNLKDSAKSITDLNIFSSRNLCLYMIAYSNKDESICNQIDSNVAKFGCIASLNNVTFNQYTFGQDIVAGEFKWKIISYKTDTEIGQYIGSGDYETFMGTKADGIFVILTVEVENVGNSANYLSDNFVKLIDDNGREFSADSGAGFYLGNDQSLAFDNINPGIIKKGKIVFDVPKGINIVAIQISDNLMQSSWYMLKTIN